MPDGNKAKTGVKVADLVGSLASKSANREKDYYDIFALSHYNGGSEKAAEYFIQRVSERRTLYEANRDQLKLVIESISKSFGGSKVGGFNVEKFTEGKYDKNDVTSKVNQFLNPIKEFLDSIMEVD